MNPSPKKRKQAAKRRNDLEKLRRISLTDARAGASLLDDGSPSRPFPSSPTPGKAIDLYHAEHNGVSQSRPQIHNELDAVVKEQNPAPFPTGFGSDSLSMKLKPIDFVLPRAQGKSQRYVFDKERAHGRVDLPTILEEMTPGEAASETHTKKKESLDEILFSQKRRRLADKFDAIHRAEEVKKEDISDISQRIADAPLAPLKPKKKKRRRSSSVDKGEEKKESSDVELKISPESTSSKVSSTSLVPDSNGNITACDDAARSSVAMPNRQWSGMSVEEAVQDKHGLRPRANSTDGELNLPQRGLCDEQMVLRSHQWLDQHKHDQKATPRGFMNLGNTCFLNSILQCLAYLPPLCQSLIAISAMKKKRLKDDTEEKPSQGQRITSSLCNLFKNVHGFPGSKSTHSGSIAPQAIVKALPSLGSIGSRNGYKFWPGRQEDAHEFLVHLLNAMHDGELRAAGINQHSSGWRDRLPVTRLDETTFIHRIFGGYFRSQVRCKACGYSSNTYDPFLDLSLEVSKKSSNSIMQSIREFTKRETLDSDNQWKCSGCKKYVCPTKQLTVFRPPLSLCIQMKRFSFDGGFPSFGGGGGGVWAHGKTKGAYGGRTKITKPIEFPSDLDLPLSDGRSCAYALTGVVAHVGGSASSGHYTAYVKKPIRNGHAHWYHADDSSVEPVSEKTVLRQNDAYILFYSRKEVKLEFPSPPPRTMSTEEALEFSRARARARADSNIVQEDSKPKPRLESPTVDGAVQRNKADIHPLAEFLNSSMSEQFKTAMSPESWNLEERCPPKKPWKESQDRNGVRKSPPEEPLARTETAGSKNEAYDQAAKQNEDESRSESDSKEERTDDEVEEAIKLVAEEHITTPVVAERSPVRESSKCDLHENDSKVSPKVKVEKLSSSSFSKSESTSASEAEPLPHSKTRRRSSSSSSSSDSGSARESEENAGSSPANSNSMNQKILKLETDASSSESESSSIKDSTEREVKSGTQPIQTASPNTDIGKKSETKLGPGDGSPSVCDSGDSEEEGKPEAMRPVVQSASPSTAPPEKPKDDRVSGSRTRVVVGSHDSRGKVKVMMGPRVRKAWKAKTMPTVQKGEAFQLLGNLSVSRWDDDEEKTASSQPSQVSKSTATLAIERDQIVKNIDKQENSRKRKMHLDRWDSLLDQGKVKKTKKKSDSTKSSVSENPKYNVFQRIQAGVQMMNKGKAKGLFRRKEGQSRR